MKQRLGALVAATAMAGCAGFTAKPVNSDAEDAVADGIRYYEVAPYLLVYPDGKGGVTSRIEMLPDVTRKMVVDLHAVASKNNTTLTFSRGMLTDASVVVDNTVIPAAIVESIKTLGVAAVKSAMNEPTGRLRQLPAPQLFKIVVDGQGTRLLGGAGVGPDGSTPMVITVAVTDTTPPAKVQP